MSQGNNNRHTILQYEIKCGDIVPPCSRGALSSIMTQPCASCCCPLVCTTNKQYVSYCINVFKYTHIKIIILIIRFNKKSLYLSEKYSNNCLV